MSEPHDGETAEALPLNMSQTAWLALEEYLFRFPAILVAVYYDENSDPDLYANIGDQFYEFKPRLIRDRYELLRRLDEYPEYTEGAPYFTGENERPRYERQGFLLYDSDGRRFDTQTGEWEA